MIRKISFVVLALCAFAAVGCRKQNGADPSASFDSPVWVFDLSRGLPESRSSGGLFAVPQRRTLLGMLEALDRAQRAPAVKGYFVRFGLGSPGWAHTEELGRRFASLKEAGHPVVCHADSLDNRSLWLAAAACSEIWLSPGGSVEAVGVGGQALYFKGLLDRLNIQAEFLHMGKYKSAAETFTESGPTEAAQESMQSLLASMRDSWREGLLSRRPDPRAADAAENGPWVPEAALAIGLIDAIGFESEAREKLATLTATQVKQAKSPLAAGPEDSPSLVSLAFQLLTGPEEKPKEAHIAVLPAIGAITYGGSGGLGSEEIAASSFVPLIRQLREDDSVKAVVLRIDSPGGSALASDLLWHELRLLGETKPLVTSVGDVAASGGYYLACATERIFSERTSLVGSIGVVGGKFTVGDALAEYGVTAHTFTPDGDAHKARVTYASPFTQWDDETRQRVLDQMQRVYTLFLERVSLGRNMPVASVQAVAEGRVWTGAQGKEHGLVDELGGLSAAIAFARDKAGLAADIPVLIEGGQDPVMELLGLSSEGSDDQAKLTALQARGLNAAALVPAWTRLFGPNELRHLGSLMPLLGTERVVTAMPFGLIVP